MVNYYDAPIPGFGRDFHHLITDEAASLSNQIGQANAQRIADDTSYVLGNLEAPGITQPIATFLYALLWLAAVVTEGLALIVVAFGVVATAVCILLGPVFIPFFIVPQLDWLFWGWLKAFIQYSFYQVVAAGVLYIVSQFTYGIIHAQITGLISPTDLITISPVLVVMYLAAIYAIVKVPMLTSHIFSGTSGGSAMVIFEKVARRAGSRGMKDNTFNEAKQLYLEQYASAIVTGGYLKIAVTLLSLVVLGLVFMNLKIVRTLESFKPLVIRIDEIGRAQAVAYESSRLQAGIQRNEILPHPLLPALLPAQSLDHQRRLHPGAVLSRRQARRRHDSAVQTEEHHQDISWPTASRRNGTSTCNRSSIEPMEKAPYKATVDFFEIEYSPADHSVAKRTLYTASFLFIFRDHVPNADILTNPLGLTITYFREDEAFIK